MWMHGKEVSSFHSSNVFFRYIIIHLLKFLFLFYSSLWNYRDKDENCTSVRQCPLDHCGFFFPIVNKCKTYFVFPEIRCKRHDVTSAGVTCISLVTPLTTGPCLKPIISLYFLASCMHAGNRGYNTAICAH